MHRHYQLLFEKNPLPMWVYDAQTLRLLEVNEAAVAHYGYDKQEFVCLYLHDLHHPDDVAGLQEHLRLPAQDHAVERMWRHRHRSGDFFEVATQTRELDLDGLRAHIVVIRDVSTQHRLEQEQKLLAKRLTDTLESITDAFLTLDRNWCFTYINARAEELLRSDRDLLLGGNVWAAFPAAIESTFQHQFERAMDENRPAHFEAFFAPWEAWLEVDAYPSDQGLTVYLRDVTQRHAAAQRMHEERETLSAVLHSTSDAIISTDVEGRVTLFNPGAERLFGRSGESMLGESIDVLMPERYRAAHRLQQRRFSESLTPSRMMGLGHVKGLRSDGQEIDLEGTISQVNVQDQKVLIVSLRDVTERLRATQELQQSKTQLTELTIKLLTQEKLLVKRLSQSLHDQLGQTMTAIRMVHETILASRPEPLSPSVQRLEQQLGTLVSQGMRQIRQVLIDLRPPLLEALGLAPALDNELRNRALTQPEVDICIEASPEISLMRWPSEVEYAAFMVAREAVENALRHSGASSITVRVSGVSLALNLVVSDNGVGMKTNDAAPAGHLGILGMHERANAIGATVTIAACETPGTCVTFHWESAA